MQRRHVVYIGLHHGHQRQHLHRSRRQSTRDHGHVHTGAVECFADMPSDEAGATQYQNIFHNCECSLIGETPDQVCVKNPFAIIRA